MALDSYKNMNSSKDFLFMIYIQDIYNILFMYINNINLILILTTNHIILLYLDGTHVIKVLLLIFLLNLNYYFLN